MNTCCCTGHRPKGFPFKYGVDKLKHNTYLQMLEEKIKLAITEYGITNFISGMAFGYRFGLCGNCLETAK